MASLKRVLADAQAELRRCEQDNTNLRIVLAREQSARRKAVHERSVAEVGRETMRECIRVLLDAIMAHDKNRWCRGKPDFNRAVRLSSALAQPVLNPAVDTTRKNPEDGSEEVRDG